MLKHFVKNRLQKSAATLLGAGFVLLSCQKQTEQGGQAEQSNSPRMTESSEIWVDQTEIYLPTTAEWTNRVELADINGDNRVDMLFANGGNYSAPGEPESSRIFLNQGPDRRFQEITDQVFNNDKFLSRVIKVRDVNGDSIPDIVVGTTYQSQSQLLLGLGKGKFKNVTSQRLPDVKASVGDLELGDVDDDGDLDMVLADWGPGSNMNNAGGRTMLWLNDGQGNFTDVTQSQMPDLLVQFSWDLEFFDFDNDFDLDVAVSCKRCATSRIFVNDGKGYFTDKRLLPAYTNNYELEPMDLDRDGFLDLVTVNDGEIVRGESSSRREHIFLNDQGKRFVDVTEEYWPDSENVGMDDNNVVFLDYDSDGDPDFLISSLTGEDRLLVNDGSGRFELLQPVLKGESTPLTLSMVLADVNNDGKLDIVMGQGEGEEGIEERVFMASDMPPDSAAPVISHFMVTEDEEAGILTVKARIHDNKSPNMPQDWSSVHLKIDGQRSVPMTWYGENLWVATLSDRAPENVEICATDYSGNRECVRVK
jgi:hypothetical protein